MKCPKCDKAVYAAEKRVAGSNEYHNFCFKCGMCNKMLDSTTVALHGVELYCKQCHGRKYGIKGYGFGGGAGALNMDTGGQFGNKDNDFKNKPAAAAAGGKVIPPEEGGCPRCGKRVYDAEKATGCPDGLSFHKSCFACKECRKKLDSTNICTNKEEKDVYCKSCYGRKFGPKGIGFGQGAGCLSTG